ncbi:hypothetical protein Lal_00021942 [Lupinus albus]|nr:hypothetical protein Lal_00021942 [Lupinus albus]
MLQVIRNIAFGNILDIGASEINNHLITTLVEQWRPETHTFIYPMENVTYQLGLPIDGDDVTGATSIDWDIVRLNLLGATPIDRQITSQRIQMS